MNPAWLSTATAPSARPVYSPLQIVIVDDCQLFRDCIAAALAEEEGFSVSLEAASPQELMERPPTVPPDVVLAAASLPRRGAVELTRWVGEEYPGAKVLVVGREEGCEAEILDSIEAGASGFVSRSQSLADLKRNLSAVAAGEAPCSPRVTHSVFSRLAELAHEKRSAAAEEPVLTSRELEILELVAEGLSNKEIAKRLIISLHTVKNHVHNVLEKLDVGGRYAAVAYAYEKRWLRRPWR